MPMNLPTILTGRGPSPPPSGTAAYMMTGKKKNTAKQLKKKLAKRCRPSGTSWRVFPASWANVAPT